jgi:hypothetical protein
MILTPLFSTGKFTQHRDIPELRCVAASNVSPKIEKPGHPFTSATRLSFQNADHFATAFLPEIVRIILGIVERALGPDYPEVATSLNDLAELYRAQGRQRKMAKLALSRWPF